MAVELNSDHANPLLGRREVLFTFKAASGLLTRQEAVKAVAEKLRTGVSNVYLIKLEGRSGTRDLRGTFYVYDSEQVAKRQLPEFILERKLARADRKKILEERRKVKPEKAPKKA